ncbi:OsmC family protein [Paenibacillus sp. P26]|nr:OsmC family protein [Paenibacillus sp. P26]UUZ97222.1 OsmC family protein [Paenibacillus sp. P25]
MIEAGYAACLNITARMVLDSMKAPYDGVTVQVELDRRDEAATVFNYRIDIQGELDEDVKRIVLNKVANCPVKKTLSKPIEFINEIIAP